MLVNHTDSLADGIQGVFNLGRLPVNQHFAFLRSLQTEQNLHKSGFSGAVLTYERKNLAFMEPEGDILVGHEAIVVYLGDAFHSQYFLSHTFSSYVISAGPTGEAC